MTKLLLAVVATAALATPTLEDRVTTLERTVEVCCSQEYLDYTDDETDLAEARFAEYVALKKRLVVLELRVQILEEEKMK